jgi:hypothetical protein
VRFPSWRQILRGIFPTVHGEYPGHLSEWRGFGRDAWAEEFRAAGFAVHKVMLLPLYSGYGFGLNALRRFGEARAWSSHNAFILSRAGEQPDRVRWFTAPELPSSASTRLLAP